MSVCFGVGGSRQKRQQTQKINKSKIYGVPKNLSGAFCDWTYSRLLHA
jgi:hypothetical protein